MNPTERYLRRATRGLWGQKRRDAVMELRGGIEDKTHRHRLGGLSEVEAERAALRDLGSPAAIARDLNRVHTGPQALRLTLLLGVTGLLGMQAVAQVAAVQATRDPRLGTTCAFDDASFERMPPKQAQELRRQLARPGERAKLEAACQESLAGLGNQLLRLADIWAAFRVSGVTVEPFPDSTLYNVTFPGSSIPRLLNLGQGVQVVRGEQYVDLYMFISALASGTDVPLQLSGTVNPTLKVGPATLQLGTPAAPVRASDVYTAALQGPLERRIDQNLAFQWWAQTDATISFHFGAAVPDGTQYAVLDNRNFFCDCMLGGASPLYLVSVQTAQGGQVFTGVSSVEGGGAPVVVSTFADLQAATRASRRALLVYRLTGSDLRQVRATPVPATGLRLQAPIGGN